jgi:hypothetical protein
MSAYICSPEHIKALALYAVHGREMRVIPAYLAYDAEGKDEIIYENLKRWGLGDNHGQRPEIAQYYANILYQENIKSVMHRYPQDTLDTAPGGHEKPPYITVTGKDYNNEKEYTPVEILKLCAGYSYQACETPDWEQSIAFSLIHRIERAAISELPGYDDAP